MKQVLDNKQEVKESKMCNILRRSVFYMIWKSEIEKKILKCLAFYINDVKRCNESVKYHDDNLRE